MSDSDKILFCNTAFNDKLFQKHDHVWYAGYFNVALSHDVDTDGYTWVNNPNARHFVKTQILAYNITDVWCIKNTNERQNASQ